MAILSASFHEGPRLSTLATDRRFVSTLPRFHFVDSMVRAFERWRAAFVSGWGEEPHVSSPMGNRNQVVASTDNIAEERNKVLKV